MDILNSTNYEYRANTINQTQVPAETKAAQSKPEPAMQAAKQTETTDPIPVPVRTGGTAPLGADQTILKALAASGLPMSERNRILVRELLNHRLPVDKQTLQMFAKLAAVNRTASPLTLVLMYKNQIPITPANLRQFEAYQNGNNQLLKDIQSLTKNIVELIKSLQTTKKPGTPTGSVGSSSTTAQTGSVSNLVNIKSDTGGATVSGTIGLPSGLVSPEGSDSSAGSSGRTGIAVHIPESDTGAEGSSIRRPSSEASNTAQSINTPSSGALNMGPSINTPSSGALNMGPSINMPSSGALNMEPVFHTESGPQAYGVLPSVDIGQGFVTESTYHGDIVTGQELLQGAVPSPEEAGAGLQLTDLLPWLAEALDTSPDQHLNSELATFPKLSAGEEGLLKNALHTLPEGILREGILPELSPEYLSNLEKLLRQKWTLTPEQLSGKNSLKDLYKKLEDDLHRLDSLIRLHREAEEILPSKEPVRNLQDNLQFMKALNQLFSYVQLPLRLKDREVHGEFYVFNKKNALLGKKDILSVLLHLNMTELGAMNIHMKLERNQIQATFAVEDPEAGSIINDHLPELIAALTRKGYHLQARVDKKENPKEFIKELLEQDPSGSSFQTFSFDTKA